jgi:transposase InsO family protein
MSWREVSVTDRRREFVELAGRPGANVSELCRRFGVVRSNGYKWLERHRLEGAAGLLDRSRRPKTSPTRTAELIEAAVLQVREQSNGAWGGRKIAKALERGGVTAKALPASTITEVLRRHGRLEQPPAEAQGRWTRFERAEPNELWQMDFKGHFGVGQSGRCHPLTVLDDHSRYCLEIGALADEQDASVRTRLAAAFRVYGLPLAMLADNGSPWGDSGGQSFTKLGVWLMRLGVRLAHGRPRHPQTQGKDERFHRTLKAEVLQGKSFGDLAACQRAFDLWRTRYNHERPHEALDMAVPAERYRISPRPFPDSLPPIEYGPGDIVRKADKDGRISFNNRLWRIGKAFARLPIALRPTLQDGFYELRFCAQPIGRIDLHDSELEACGFVDDADASPTTPQAQPQPPQI